MEGDMRMQEAVEAKAAGVVARKWRVLQTNPNAERTALANVRRLGLEAYLPMAITERPATAKRPAATIIRPFLPGYMFVRFDTRLDPWGDLFTTIGVKAILRAGLAPLAVPDSEVEALRQREEAGLIKISDPSDVAIWRKGDRVRVTYPRAEIEAVFEELLDKDRAVVFVSILGKLSRQVVTPLLLK